MLVCAFAGEGWRTKAVRPFAIRNAGREVVLAAYAHAVRERYRFYSVWRLHAGAVSRGVG